MDAHLGKTSAGRSRSGSPDKPWSQNPPAQSQDDRGSGPRGQRSGTCPVSSHSRVLPVLGRCLLKNHSTDWVVNWIKMWSHWRTGFLLTVGRSGGLLCGAALHLVDLLLQVAKTLQIWGLVGGEEFLDLFQRTLDFLPTGTILEGTGETMWTFWSQMQRIFEGAATWPHVSPGSTCTSIQEHVCPLWPFIG